jgi:hypothetical protein
MNPATNTTWNPDYKDVFGPTYNPLTDWTKPIGPVWDPTKYPGMPPNAPIVTEDTAKKIQDQLKDQTAIRYDHGKTDWSLMPFEAIEEINKVLDFGAKKYAAHNWKKGEGFKYTRVLNSLLRHIFAYMRGEDKDPESGLNHLAHAGCNIVFLLYYSKYKERYKNDDRV